MSKKIIEGLNEQQITAVKNYMGPCFVIAGPGAGKTSVIVRRTAYMIKEGINPKNILLFTFTKKAANEIRERIRNYIGDLGLDVTVGTYHSICVKILRKYNSYIDYKTNFSIYDEEDVCGIIKELLKKSNIDYKILRSYIRSKKEKLISPSIAIIEAKDQINQNLSSLYKQYQKELKKNNAMDFDDLLFNTIKLLKSNKIILKKVNNQYQYIIADESQDSSFIDIELIKLLKGENDNLCMIADDDQSIYSFRGSNVEELTKLRKEINPKVFLLEQNYRCSKHILNSAKSLIKNNDHDINKEIFTNNQCGTIPIYFQEKDQDDEALRLIKLIMLLNKKYNLKYKDIAILYRMNYMSRKIEDGLLRAGIPYKIIAGCPFYTRKEIKDIICYLRFILNNYDFEAFKRIINIPKKGIGNTTVDKINVKSDNFDNNYFKTIYNIELKGKAKNGLDLFKEHIKNILDFILKNQKPNDIIEFIIKEIDYINYIKEEEKKEDIIEDKIENLNELINIASSFDNIEEFCENLTLDSQIEENEEDDKIQLLTMHSSKGLEFPAVIIYGAIEGCCPHYKATEYASIQEERRLFYVAMTRAKKYLFITNSRLVEQRGMIKGAYPSRFIKEIDKKYLIYYKK